MSEDQLASSSFGDPNAQPPTPRQTPTPAVFASPVFETPKNPQGSFTDATGLTPRFAEDYSVFNSTPGNLRGTQGPFADFVSATPFRSSLGHKRLLSVEELAVEIATRAILPLTNPHVPLPPVELSRRLPSSPASLIFATKGPPAGPDAHPSPTFPPTHNKSSKKACRGTLESPGPTQILSPPPSARKGGQELAPKANMQDDQNYGQPDFSDNLQAHEMAAMMGNAGDMFGYPMSAPPTQAHFWDPAMGMDLDFGAAAATYFQPSHRHTGSFDWNSEIQLFQDPCPPPQPSSNQENVQPNVQNVQPARRERALAPKPPVSEQACSAMAPTFHTSMDDPFGLMSPMEGVDPGLLFSRPQTSAMETDFNHIANAGSAEVAVAEASNSRTTAQPRRTSGVKEAKKGKMPDRSFTSSPVKSSAQPGLGRSSGENRGKKALERGTLPTLAPAARPTPQAGSSGIEAGRPGARPSGRISPLKNQRRLSSLASIPESVSQPQLGRPRTSVRFTIDAHGRARAETTIEPGTSGAITRSRSSRELSTTRRNWDSSDGESSTDEEPIIIPSRNNSFASFALPDPRRSVGSLFHPSRRSVSDRGMRASSSATLDGSGAPPTEGESEAETVMNDPYEKGGDAASELRKVVEDRQKRSMQMGNARSQRLLAATNAGGFNGSTISPVSLTDSSHGAGGRGVRCVCNRNEVDEGNGFMLQCESCEMWLHGRCVNLTRRTMPSVYICGFCANTGNAAGRRVRDTGRGNAVAPTPLVSFRSFR